MAVMSCSENGSETPSMPPVSRPLPFELVELVDVCLAGVGGEGKYEGEGIGPLDELDVAREASKSSEMTVSIGWILVEPFAPGRVEGGPIGGADAAEGAARHVGAHR